VLSVQVGNDTKGQTFTLVTDSITLTTGTADTTPPDTTITAGPSGTVADTEATFEFASNEPNSTFECRLDLVAFTSCTSPVRYSSLEEGAHHFEVRAIDAAGNIDATPADRDWIIDTGTSTGPATLFSDGFESGTMSAWTAVRTAGDGAVVVQGQTVHEGQYAARLSASTSTAFAYARQSLSSAQSDLTSSAAVRVEREGASGGNVPLLRLYNAGGARLVNLYRQNQSSDRVWVQHSGGYHATSGRLPLDTWGRVQLRTVTAGSSASTVEVHLDGALVYSTTGASLGTGGVLSVQVGNDTKGQTFTLVTDSITLTTGTADTTPPEPEPGTAVLVGAGDIADCNNPGDDATAQLLDGVNGTVFTTGDNVYPEATATQLTNCYGPSWGRHKSRTRPSLGNHDYVKKPDGSLDATAYFNYFGSSAGDPAKGYYSYDAGSWHVIVLNSNCAQVGGCGTGSPQEQWLRNDLAAHSNTCTAAYWHHPRFSSGSHGSVTAMQPFWQALYDHGADVVLAGHDHHYERFAPQTPTGAPDARYGIRQFVVGSGGFSHYKVGTPLANSEVRNDDTFGVLKLVLSDGGYKWQFIPEAGKTFTDTGEGSCHSVPPRG
jgi:hypothetical protein